MGNIVTNGIVTLNDTDAQIITQRFCKCGHIAMLWLHVRNCNQSGGSDSFLLATVAPEYRPSYYVYCAIASTYLYVSNASSYGELSPDGTIKIINARNQVMLCFVFTV